MVGAFEPAGHLCAPAQTSPALPLHPALLPQRRVRAGVCEPQLPATTLYTPSSRTHSDFKATQASAAAAAPAAEAPPGPSRSQPAALKQPLQPYIPHPPLSHRTPAPPSQRPFKFAVALLSSTRPAHLHVTRSSTLWLFASTRPARLHATDAFFHYPELLDFEEPSSTSPTALVQQFPLFPPAATASPVLGRQGLPSVALCLPRPHRTVDDAAAYIGGGGRGRPHCSSPTASQFHPCTPRAQVRVEHARMHASTHARKHARTHARTHARKGWVLPSHRRLSRRTSCSSARFPHTPIASSSSRRNAKKSTHLVKHTQGVILL